MASASSSARAVPAAPSPAIMMVWSARDFPVNGCAARMPASTTAAVPYNPSNTLEPKYAGGSKHAPFLAPPGKYALLTHVSPLGDCCILLEKYWRVRCMQGIAGRASEGLADWLV